MKIKPPFLRFMDVKAKVDSFRANYEVLNCFPVDIDTFLECDLQLEIVPFPRLRARTAAEAILSLDFTTVFVDSDCFQNDTLWNRMKFSLAHEIGHLILHRDFLEGLNILNENDWFKFMNNMTTGDASYCFLEHHANWFAGMLLVPSDELVRIFQTSSPTLPALTRYFGVSQAVIARRLDAEDVRPKIEAILENG